MHSGSWYGTQADHPDASVHKLKSIINTFCSKTLISFAFYINKKQYQNTFHKQKKSEMHLWMHNNDFDRLLRSDHYSAKLQIAKIHKNAQKFNCYMYNTSWMFDFSYELYLVQYLQLCLGIPHPISPNPMSRYRTGYRMS